MTQRTDDIRVNTVIAQFVYAVRSCGLDWRSGRRFFTVEESDLMDAMDEANDLLRSQEREATALRQRVKELEEALTPSAETKAAYIGEFKFTLRAGVNEFGDDHVINNVQVPWTTIKEIMEAIRARALTQEKAPPTRKGD